MKGISSLAGRVSVGARAPSNVATTTSASSCLSITTPDCSMISWTKPLIHVMKRSCVSSTRWE